MKSRVTDEFLDGWNEAKEDVSHYPVFAIGQAHTFAMQWDDYAAGYEEYVSQYLLEVM